MDIFAMTLEKIHKILYLLKMSAAHLKHLLCKEDYTINMLLLLILREQSWTKNNLQTYHHAIDFIELQL